MRLSPSLAWIAAVPLLGCAALAPCSRATDATASISPCASSTPWCQPSLTLTGERWDNVSGGLRTGSRWNSLADLTLEIDLARLGGPAGASLTAQLFWIENQKTEADFGALTGGANPVSGLNAADSWRVFNLYYRQSWGDNRFALKVGQLAIDDDFMGSDYAGLFAFSGFGAMPTQVATPLAASHDHHSAFPIYAVAGPGIWFSAKATEKLTLQAGLYHGGPGPDERDNHGFDYDDAHGAGLVLFYEASYRFAFTDHASTLRAGGSIHTGRFDDFAALNAGAEVATVRGIHSFYAIQDLVLLAADADHPKLAAFWRAGLSPQQDRSVVHRYADAGLNWFAPLPSRADDIAGIAISYTEFGREYRRTDQALAAAETALELTYRAKVTEHLALQAIVQRLFNPRPADDGHRHPATVLGLRAEWSY